MERNEISEHEVRVYQILKDDPSKWWTTKEMTPAAKVAKRTAALHLQRFAQLGVVDQVEIFPNHRYRLSAKSRVRNKAYVQRLEQAVEIIGAEKPKP